MATFEQIAEVRLIINDPPDVIELEEVDALPTDPDPQIGYKLTTDGRYYVDGEAVELEVSDTRIGNWIDSVGQNGAICNAIQQILNRIGKRLLITRTQGGAESTDFINLTTLQTYYERLKETYEEDAVVRTTGVYGKQKRPQIAGGEV